MSLHVIAEAGSNHNGNLELAQRLNIVAAEARADSVKYQIIYTDELYRKGSYPYGNYSIDEVRRIRREGEFDEEEWQIIRDHAASLPIPFSASIFDSRGLKLLCSMQPPYIKTASCDLNNLRLLRDIAKCGLPMIVSTGMSSLGDIEKAVSVIFLEGLAPQNLVLMHCVSVYPCPLADTNLSFVATLKAAFGTEVGFSDHTRGSEAACAAVALGATWIEKHFTVDRTLPGFDHMHASEADELKTYVEKLRFVEASLQPKRVKITDAERTTRQRARRGVYFASALPSGHVVRSSDLVLLRPETAIAADEADLFVGLELRRSVAEHDPVDHAVLQPPSKD